MEEFYPMPAFVTLFVKDLAISTQWYKEALGFRVVYEAPPPVSLVHLRRERYQDLLLLLPPPGTEITPSPSIVMSFNAGDTKVADLHESVRTVGGHFEGPIERPWNVRELTVTDPDGYIIKFVEPISLNRSFDEVMGNVAKASEGKG